MPMSQSTPASKSVSDGTVTSVRGSVVDVQFAASPPIYTLLRTGNDGNIALEVQMQLPWPTKNLPEVIGGREAALPAFVREYLFVSMFKACAESLAAENASRLVAMQRAEKNIDDLAERLNQTLRRLRQTSIDEELFDVLSGYESLSNERSR